MCIRDRRLGIGQRCRTFDPELTKKNMALRKTVQYKNIANFPIENAAYYEEPDVYKRQILCR